MLALSQYKQESLEESFGLKSEQWKRLGEVIHPGSYGKKYPVLATCFKRLREDELSRTWEGAYNKCVQENRMSTALTLLKGRPGNFARKLDHFLRISDTDSQMSVVQAFANVSDYVPLKNLLNLLSFYKERPNFTQRVIVPKGTISKLVVQEYTPHPIPDEIIKELILVLEMTIKRKLVSPEKIKRNKKVFVDPFIKQIKLPYDLRNLSSDKEVISKGSRIPVDLTGKTLRLFSYWKDSCDIDTSAAILDSDLKVVEYCNFTRLVSKSMKHSDDFVDGTNGVSEFIDIDLETARSSGRYVVFNQTNYSGKSFKDVAINFCGYMMVDDPSILYQPESVKSKFSLTADSTNVAVMALDLHTSEIVWLETYGAISYSSVFNAKDERTRNILKGYLSNYRTNFEDFLKLYNEANDNTEVGSESDAETVFGREFAYDVNSFSKKYLG
jgi:stress response protein SCP2